MSQKNRMILIHGLHQAPFIMRPMARRMQAQGFDTYQYGYRSMRDGIKTNSARLNSWLEANHHPDQLLDLVAHSLGGLIVRDFIYNYPQWQIGRCVTLGTPHNGSVCADYIWQLTPAIVGKEVEIKLAEDRHTATSVEIFVNPKFETEGTYWVEILLDGQLRMRYPLAIRIVQKPGG